MESRKQESRWAERVRELGWRDEHPLGGMGIPHMEGRGSRWGKAGVVCGVSNRGRGREGHTSGQDPRQRRAPGKGTVRPGGMDRRGAGSREDTGPSRRDRLHSEARWLMWEKLVPHVQRSPLPGQSGHTKHLGMGRWARSRRERGERGEWRGQGGIRPRPEDGRALSVPRGVGGRWWGGLGTALWGLESGCGGRLNAARTPGPGCGSSPRARRSSPTRSWSPRRRGPGSDPSLRDRREPLISPGDRLHHRFPAAAPAPREHAPSTHAAAAPRAPGSGCTARQTPRSPAGETTRAAPAWRLRVPLRTRRLAPGGGAAVGPAPRHHL